MLSLLGYEPSDLLGKSMYECHHASDADHLMGTFKHGKYFTNPFCFTLKTFLIKQMRIEIPAKVVTENGDYLQRICSTRNLRRHVYR